MLENPVVRPRTCQIPGTGRGHAAINVAYAKGVAHSFVLSPSRFFNASASIPPRFHPGPRIGPGKAREDVGDRGNSLFDSVRTNPNWALALLAQGKNHRPGRRLTSNTDVSGTNPPQTGKPTRETQLLSFFTNRPCRIPPATNISPCRGSLGTRQCRQSPMAAYR